ncbi:hypothetical protein [Sphingobacterium sp. DR205]|uniref:hypothetical protein n=1 Tax=Sphingobacterium sp. DR205 TaxID=2713573 RepID=UPI0013E4F55E|nr:hypothetical protein [Sphingobacterium sp. DR205]QIH34494.1 hypothetical protein G6053_17065 [Sphingobacterium sp. DR205]
MMKKQILLFYVLLCGIIYGQSTNRYAPVTYPTSPDVTKIQTYGQVPVTPYSGLANVSIPIYTIKEGDFEFPISLNYNTRGIKVKEEATRVGLGWSLGFPGLISRSMIGQDDFIGNPTSSAVGSVNANGKYFNARANNGSLVPDFTGYMHGPQSQLKLGLDTRIMPTDYKLDEYTNNSYYTRENIDFQPDNFSYSIPKFSGKFIFARNKKPILEKLEDNLKIEVLDSLDYLGQATMKKMKIIDKEGTTYTFDDFERYHYTGLFPTYIDNAWYVSKIKTRTGNEIKFTYDILETVPSYNLYDYAGMPVSLYNDCGGLNGLSPCGTFPFGESKTYEGLQYFKSKLVKKIQFPQGIIEFEYENREDIYQDKKISKIFIKDNKNALIQTIKLNYEYFVANYNSVLTDLGEWQQNMNGFAERQKYLNNRLKLTSVQILDRENNLISSQNFEYFDQNVPAKNSTAVDLWGYFNGVNNNPHLFPDFDLTVPNSSGNSIVTYYTGTETTVHIPGSNRNVNPSVTNSMLLKKIIYPTKGSSEFIYESNTYDPVTSFQNDLSASKISFFMNSTNSYNYAGGLRIKSIINRDNEGGVYATDYSYHDENNPNKSWGYLTERPNLFDLRKRSNGVPGSQFYDPADINGMNAYILIRNHALYDDNFIGYKKVTETQQNNGNIIKKEYEYNVAPTLVYSHVFAFGRGLEAPTPTYTEPQYLFIKTSMRAEPFDFRPYHTEITSSQQSIRYKRDYSFHYKPFELKDERGTYNGLLLSVKNYAHENQIFKLVDSEDYAYNIYYNQKQYWGVIYGHAVHERLGSSSDWSFSFHNPLYSIVQPLYYPVVQTKGYNPGQYNLTYKAILSLYNPGPSSIVKTKFFGGQAFVTTTDYSYGNVTQPDPIGNLTSQKTTFPDNSSQTSKYSYAIEKGNQLLINRNIISLPLETINTETIGNTTETLSKIETIYPTALPTAQTGNLVLPLSVISYDVQNTASTEVIYDQYDSKGNILQYTTKDGIVTSIIWGYNSTQPIAKVTGVSYAVANALAADIISASNADIDAGTEQTLIGKLDIFRKESSLQNAQLTTYTYDPLVGVTSITPPSGIREIYKYDSANRLQNIKDVTGKLLKEFNYNYKP